MDSVKLQDTKSTYKNQLCFDTLTMNYLKRKLGKQSHLQVSKRVKYLGINLTKEVKGFYTEKSLMKDTNEWKDIP